MRAAVMLRLFARQHEPYLLDPLRLIQNDDQEVRETGFESMVGLELSKCLTPVGKSYGTGRLIQGGISSVWNGSSLRRRFQFGPVTKLDTLFDCHVVSTHDLFRICMRLNPRGDDDVKPLWSANTLYLRGLIDPPKIYTYAPFFASKKFILIYTQ